jgi:glucokinase
MTEPKHVPLAIGIDFGGTTIKIALVRGETIVNRGSTIITGDYREPDALIRAMATEINSLQQAHPEICAVGVGLPGWVDYRTGYVHNLTNVPGWQDVKFSAKLREHVKLPVTIDNDATAMTYAEHKFGAAKASRNAVCLTMGTGVGGGFILEGKLHRGSKMSAGEIGMMTVDMHGVKGAYGNDGMVEAYVGHARIAERARQLFEEAGEPRTLEQCDPRNLDEAARAGNAIALRVWDEVGQRMGAMLADLIWALSIDTIVIGGGVSKAGDILFDPIRRHINGRVPEFFHDYNLVPAHFSNDAGIIGCAALAVDLRSKEDVWPAI